MHKELSSEWAKERLWWNATQGVLVWVSQVLVLSGKVVLSSQRWR